jgi:hypothetical protein
MPVATMIDLCDFVRNGRLGTIMLGAMREEVQSAFGQPVMWDAKSGAANAKIWKYGALEIHFQAHQVWMIFTDALPALQNDALFEARGLSAEMTAEDVDTWFRKNNIEYERLPFPYCNHGLRFKSRSGVTLTLCAEEENEEARFCSIALTQQTA